MNQTSGVISNAHWLLRIVLASVFIYHGVGKVVDVQAFAGMMDLPVAVAWLITFAELAGGLGILIGGFTSSLITRLAGLAIVPVMLGAIFMVHWGKWGFAASESHPMGGMEFQFSLLLVALYFVIVGNQRR